MRLPLLPRPRALLLLSVAIAGLVAVWAGGPAGDGHRPRHVAGAQSVTADRPSAEPRHGDRLGAGDFAGQVARALLGYDTGSSRARWRRAVLSLAGAPEGSLGAHDIDLLIPDDGQWEQMAAVHQRATVTVRASYVPTLWTQTAAQHPELPDGSVGMTVTGTQLVTWDGGTSRVPVAVTLLLLCPPATQRCVLSRVLAQVAR